MLALGVGAAGCGASGDAAGSGGKVSVVASFYPLAEAAESVGADRVVVTNLTPPGVEPHDLELTPDEVEAIATADVVLYLGGGFQPGVEEAAGQTEGLAIDLLRAVPEGSAADPHVWLDPTLMAAIVREVEAALSKADMDGAEAFAANADSYSRQLADLDEELRAGLTGCERDVIVTSHAAFGHLAARYGLTQQPISGLSPEAEPDPQRLAELAALVHRDGVTTIFTEALLSPRVAEALAEEAGVATAVLDPIESLSPEQVRTGEDYLSVMRDNLAALRQALGCPE
ncbi:MAG: metal ABC transporter substrate-binding protein [Actinomycetota bacterium]